MFRKIRRAKQLLSQEETVAVLKRNTCGTLALIGDDNYPYAVPLSYVYMDGKLYFHSAKEGHKIDAVKKNEKASFCVVDQDRIVPEKYTTHYRSVIVFGRVRLLENVNDMERIATALAMKYSADFKDGIPGEIDAYRKNLAIIEMEAEHITGKEALELSRQRESEGNYV